MRFSQRIHGDDSREDPGERHGEEADAAIEIEREPLCGACLSLRDDELEEAAE